MELEMGMSMGRGTCGQWAGTVGEQRGMPNRNVPQECLVRWGSRVQGQREGEGSVLSPRDSGVPGRTPSLWL